MVRAAFTMQPATMGVMPLLQLATWLVTAVVSGVLAAAMAPNAPGWRIAVGAASIGLFLLWSAYEVLERWRRLGRAGHHPSAWHDLIVKIFWWGDLAVTVWFWLLMPFASEAIFLFAVLALVVASVFQLSGTVRSPRSGPPLRSARYLPLALPLMVIAYLLVNGGPFAVTLIFFLVVVIGPLWLLRENLQRALQRSFDARLEAETARDARTRFMAAASHDLGQPLRAARLLLRQSVQHPDPAARARAADSAGEALASMQRLVEAMLGHLRLQSDGAVPDWRDVPLAETIGRIASQFEGAAQLQRVALHIVPSSAVVTTDGDLLERALSNLVDNALRHARARRILVGVRRRIGAVRLLVVDDGDGVPLEDRPHLFEAFRQGQGAGAGERGGFGLGLASVRQIADLLRGRCGLDERWRGGSAFYIELPLGDGHTRA